MFPGSRESLSAPAVNANPPRGRVSPVSTVNIPGFPDSAGMGALSRGTSAGVEFPGAGGCVGASVASEGGASVVAAGVAFVEESALAAAFESFDVASSLEAAPFIAAVAVVADVAEAGALSSIRAACAARAPDAPKISNIPAQSTQDFIPASVPPARTPQAPQPTLGLTRVVKNSANRNGLVARSGKPLHRSGKREFGIICASRGHRENLYLRLELVR